MVDDLVIAFIMRCDSENLTLFEGMENAEELAEELLEAAEDRASYAPGGSKT